MKRITRLHVTIISIVVIVATLGVAFLDYWKFVSHADEIIHLKINDAVVSAELAVTPMQWQTGLSGRPSMEKNSGMLFVFPWRRNYTFWMKDMRFPLDIIFIDGTEIVDLVENLPAPSQTTGIATYTVQEKAGRVLEVPAGWAAKNHVKRGDHMFVLTW